MCFVAPRCLLINVLKSYILSTSVSLFPPSLGKLNTELFKAHAVGRVEMIIFSYKQIEKIQKTRRGDGCRM